MRLRALSLCCLIAAALVSYGTAAAAPAEGKSRKPAEAPKGQMKQSPSASTERPDQPQRIEQQQKIQEQERARVHAEQAGSETSAEMRERNQERKEIQNEYKAAKQSGEGEAVKGKKPWWKFWESDAGT